MDEDVDNNHGLPYATRKEAIRAALRGNLEELRRLVEQDRRLLEIDDGEYIPLKAAADHSCPEVIGYLLAEGIQVNLRDLSGLTAPRTGLAPLQHGPSQ
jgi:hypothetical protein